MNKIIKILAVLIIIINRSGTQINSGIYMNNNFINSNNLYDRDYLKLDFNNNNNMMERAHKWSNHGMFNCIWDAGNIDFSNGTMFLKIDKNNLDYSYLYSGSEYRTKNYFGYGLYKVCMKAIKNDGVVTSFFSYTGKSDNTQWDEIDIEILGKDTTKAQFNYYNNGIGNHEYIYDLGFDASEDFHTYAFLWDKNSITWYVDNIPVYKVTEDIPTTPGKIMMNVWPGTGVDDWLKEYDGKFPLIAEYKWASYSKMYY